MTIKPHLHSDHLVRGPSEEPFGRPSADAQGVGESVTRLDASTAKDAALYHALRAMYYAAHFHPQDMDLPEGVALIFMAPKGTRVSADLDTTIAGITPKTRSPQ